MKKAALVGSLAIAALIAGPSSTGFAHHAVQNQFDVSYTLQKKGVLQKIDWINPHAWFHFGEIDADGKPVLGPDGRQVVWSTETTGPNGLRRAGISDRRLFEIGKVYEFSGFPDRTYDPQTGQGGTKMFTESITFPDGRTLGIATFQDVVIPKPGT